MLWSVSQRWCWNADWLYCYWDGTQWSVRWIFKMCFRLVKVTIDQGSNKGCSSVHLILCPLVPRSTHLLVHSFPSPLVKSVYLFVGPPVSQSTCSPVHSFAGPVAPVSTHSSVHSLLSPLVCQSTLSSAYLFIHSLVYTYIQMIIVPLVVSVRMEKTRESWTAKREQTYR